MLGLSSNFMRGGRSASLQRIYVGPGPVVIQACRGNPIGKQAAKYTGRKQSDGATDPRQHAGTDRGNPLHDRFKNGSVCKETRQNIEHGSHSVLPPASCLAE